MARRRQDGVIVPLSSSLVGHGDGEPVELIVREGTDQGQRKAGRIARAYIPGTQRILAELSFPRLVHLRRHDFVLAGIERRVDAYKQPIGFAQSWVCQLAPPINLFELQVGEMFFYGQPVPRSRLRDRNGGCHVGQVEIMSLLVAELGRQSMIATFTLDSGAAPKRLIDVELRWMSEVSFELAGTHLSAAGRANPETAYEGGWLCSYVPPQPPS